MLAFVVCCGLLLCVAAWFGGTGSSGNGVLCAGCLPAHALITTASFDRGTYTTAARTMEPASFKTSGACGWVLPGVQILVLRDGTFMANPSEEEAGPDAAAVLTESKMEESTMCPGVPVPHAVSRPVAGFINYRTADGLAQRVYLMGDTLRCVAHYIDVFRGEWECRTAPVAVHDEM